MRAVGPAMTAAGVVEWTIRDGWRIVDDEGRSSAVLAAENIDIDGLDDGRRRQLIGAFTTLCRAAAHPMVILVRRRPIPAPDVVGISRLDRAVADHCAARFATQPAYRNTIFCVITTDTSSERELDRAVRRTEGVLQGGGLATSQVTGPDLAALVESGVLSRGWRHASTASTILQGLRVTALPGQPVTAGWLRPLLTTNATYDLGLHFRPVSTDVALRRLQRGMREHGSQHLLEIERTGAASPHTSVAIDSILSLRERIARNEVGAVETSITCLVRARSEDELNTSVTAVRAALDATGCAVHTTYFQHHAALRTVQPTGYDALAPGKLTTSDAAATLLPWVCSDISDPDGYSIGVASQGGAPVSVNPFATRHHPNANIGVFAASGAGKSFLLGTIILEAARSGAGAIIVDPEGEHRRTVAALDGEYLSLGPLSTSAINVLELCRDDDRGVAVDFIDILSGAALSASQRALVDRAVDVVIGTAAASGATPLLHNCAAQLRAQLPDVALVIERICRGPLAAVFDRPTSLRLDASVTGIGLRELPDELLPATALVVAHWIWRTVCDDPRRRHVVFDEVGALDPHPSLRRLLVQLARRCRKYGASLVVATQNIGDLVRSADGAVIASNCAVVLLGGHRATETNLMQQTFGLTAQQRWRLEHAERGDFLLIAGHRRLAMRVDVPGLYRDILDGRHTDTDRLAG